MLLRIRINQIVKKSCVLLVLIGLSFTAQAVEVLKVDQDGGVLKEDLVASYKKDYASLFCDHPNISSSYPTVTNTQCKTTVTDVIGICIQYHFPNMPDMLYVEKKSKKWNETNGVSYWSNILNVCISEKYYLIYSSAYVTPK